MRRRKSFGRRERGGREEEGEGRGEKIWIQINAGSKMSFSLPVRFNLDAIEQYHHNYYTPPF